MNVNVTVGDFKSAAVDAVVIGVFEGEESTRSGIVHDGRRSVGWCSSQVDGLGRF